MVGQSLPASECPRRVLVIDGLNDAADTTALLVRCWGHDVQVAYDGPRALEAAGRFRPQVVLSSLSLPGVDGFVLAQRLRAGAAFADTALIAVSGWASVDDQARAQEAGFDLHLVKPVDPVVLHQVLEMARTELHQLQSSVRQFNARHLASIADLRLLIRESRAQNRLSRELLDRPASPWERP
jgi:two-component system CheB/CheR fusion protein